MSDDLDLREYEVFDLAIEATGDGGHRARVIDSPAGQAWESFEMPLAGTELQQSLVALEQAVMTERFDFADRVSPDWVAARTIGSQLFEAVFQGEVLRVYAASYARAHEKGDGLRIQMRIRDESLNEIPWECLYDTDEESFVGLRPRLSLARYPEVLGAPRPVEVGGDLKVLGVVVDLPSGQSIDARREKDLIDDALGGIEGIEVEWMENPTGRQLRDRVHAGDWHVFHYVGHARPGHISLNDDGGMEPSEMTAGDLAAILGDKPSLRLAVINACESARGDGQNALEATGRAIAAADVSAVVSMQYKIIDGAATEFARAFYEAIARRESLDEAVARARTAIYGAVESTLQWIVPVFHVRSGNGTLFASPTSSIAIAGLVAEGRSLFRGGKWGPARKVFEELMRLDQENPAWPGWRGLVLVELGEHAEAQDQLGTSLPLLDAALAGDPGDLELRSLRGLARSVLGQCDGALEDLEAAINGRIAGAAEHISRARCHAKKGNSGLAVADYTQSLALDPERCDALHERARLRLAAGEYDQALADLDRAVALCATDVQYRQTRARVFEKQRNYGRAAADLNLAIESQPDDARLYVQRGLMRYHAAYVNSTGDYETALADLTAALALAPQDGEIWSTLGTIHLQAAAETDSEDHLDRAISAFTNSTTYSPAIGRFHRALGTAQRKRGLKREARASFLRAIELGDLDARDELSVWDRLIHRR